MNIVYIMCSRNAALMMPEMGVESHGAEQRKNNAEITSKFGNHDQIMMVMTRE